MKEQIKFSVWLSLMKLLSVDKEIGSPVRAGLFLWRESVEMKKFFTYLTKGNLYDKL